METGYVEILKIEKKEEEKKKKKKKDRIEHEVLV